MLKTTGNCYVAVNKVRNVDEVLFKVTFYEWNGNKLTNIFLHKTLHPEQRSRNSDYPRVGRSKVRNEARARDFFLFFKIPKEPPT